MKKMLRLNDLDVKSFTTVSEIKARGGSCCRPVCGDMQSDETTCGTGPDCGPFYSDIDQCL